MTFEELVAAGKRIADLLRQRDVHIKKLRFIEAEIKELSDLIQADIKARTEG